MSFTQKKIVRVSILNILFQCTNIQNILQILIMKVFKDFFGILFKRVYNF